MINEKESNIDLTEKAGQLFNSYRDKADESIYARGKSGGVITTKDIEQATEFYILAGYEQSDAEDKAVEYMLQRDATYQRAIAAGYSVSDDEINDYLDDLKVTINDSINSEEAQALISQFGSEEGYAAGAQQKTAPRGTPRERFFVDAYLTSVGQSFLA